MNTLGTIREYLRRRMLLVRYQMSSFGGQPHSNCSDRPLSDPNTIDIVVVAFNDAGLIERQHAELKHYLSGTFCYTVVDNSSDEARSEEIRQLCASQAIAYIRLPQNPYSSRSPSDSHGLALNWAYRHYVRPRAADYFGFLDHDVFPTKPASLIQQLKHQPVYGHLQIRGQQWYLWPGFSFFRRDAVEGKNLNFMPITGLDTGGGNWPVIYAGLSKSDLSFSRHRYRSLGKGNDVQANKVEYFDGWLHLINASNWKQLAARKDVEILVKP